MPELPKLSLWPRSCAGTRSVTPSPGRRGLVFGAENVRPAAASLSGQKLTDVGRHGKFLDISSDSGLHLIMHLARAGWLRWRDEQPATAQAGKEPAGVPADA